MTKLPGLVLFALCVLVTAPAFADIAGSATVIDGDTIEIGGERIHLWGIDAPELDQKCREPESIEWPCGVYAKQILVRLVENRIVTCTVQGEDRGRWIAAVCTVDDRDVAWAMVAFGFALDYPVCSRGAYSWPQRESAAVRAGVWSGSFVAPWEWRRGVRLE